VNSLKQCFVCEKKDLSKRPSIFAKVLRRKSQADETANEEKLADATLTVINNELSEVVKRLTNLLNLATKSNFKFQNGARDQNFFSGIHNAALLMPLKS
jgi:hypothetical protein